MFYDKYLYIRKTHHSSVGDVFGFHGVSLQVYERALVAHRITATKRNAKGSYSF